MDLRKLLWVLVKEGYETLDQNSNGILFSSIPG